MRESMSQTSRRRMEKDLKKLTQAGYPVDRDPSNPQQAVVSFKGPNDTPYQGGTWRVAVYIPDSYPFKSPSMGFLNKIYHPNVDYK